MKIRVFIVGSKGLPAKYGGFETFVDNLTKRKTNDDIKYYVFGFDKEASNKVINDATCINISIRKDTPLNRIFIVSKALKKTYEIIKNSNDEDYINIVYILGCRVGLLIKKHYKLLKSVNAKVLFNPDGLEWKRTKWNRVAKCIVKISERRMMNNCDYVICDSKGIKDYILSKYDIPSEKVSYIAYGSDIKQLPKDESKLDSFLKKYNLSRDNYYLVVGRFVEENNFKLIINEFLKADTEKSLVLVTNVEKNRFYKNIYERLSEAQKSRIVFCGTIYDSELLSLVRKYAFAYIHGHSVGGTNPSLLEALTFTKINLLYDVIFNKEVGESECLYFNSAPGSFSSLINDIEANFKSYRKQLNPIDIIRERYSWELIVLQYESLFINFGK